MSPDANVATANSSMSVTNLRLEIRLLTSMFSVRPPEWSVAVVGRPPLRIARTGRNVVQWTWYDGTTFQAGRLRVENGYPQRGVAGAGGPFWRQETKFGWIPARTFS